jgi:hypothetical protein
MGPFLKALMPCIKEGCQKTFEYTIDTDHVRAFIRDGGGVEIEWPQPDVPPAGWTHSDFTGCYYCPEHS